jgi:ubiquinone/menaquinone biosynthesis C-methylase UbiE
MHDQKQHWNTQHQEFSTHHYSSQPSEFAQEVLSIISPKSNILELGCGAGNDAIAFAKAGHTVLATDFSDVAITIHKQRAVDIINLTFEVLDISQPTQFEDNRFDVVYARLSLHYFSDEITQQIFKEIHRILRPDGLLCFICKSTDDPLYGKGIEIEKDIYEYNEHIRHFFSETYALDCLRNKFAIVDIESGRKKFYAAPSAFIKIIARAEK